MRRHTKRLGFLFAALSFAIAPAREAVAQWDAEQQLTSGSIGAIAVGASGTAVHSVWSTGWGGADLRYRRSMDEGGSWSQEITIATGAGIHFTQPLVVDGASVYVVYVKDFASFPVPWGSEEVGDLFFVRSEDGGTTWESPIQLTNNQTVFRYAVSTSGGRVDVVWSDFRAGTAAQSQVFYRRSPNGGASWDPEVTLVDTSTGVFSARPHVASSGQFIHVVWEDERDARPPCFTLPSCPNDYYKRSTDGGQTWEPDVRIGDFAGNAYGRPEIAVVPASGNVVYGSQDILVPFNQINEAMFVRVSTNAGAAWAPVDQLTFSQGNADHAMLFAAGTTVYLAWMDNRNDPSGNPGATDEVYFKMSPDGGLNWTNDEKVSSSIPAITQGVAATQSYAHVVYNQNGAGFYRRRAALAGSSSNTTGAGGADGSGGTSSSGVGGATGTTVGAGPTTGSGADTATSSGDAPPAGATDADDASGSCACRAAPRSNEPWPALMLFAAVLLASGRTMRRRR